MRTTLCPIECVISCIVLFPLRRLSYISYHPRDFTSVIELFQINCALPHRICQCYICKKSGISLAILQLFLGNPEWENKKVCVDFFLEIRAKIRIFVQKTWKSRTRFYRKKFGNPASSMEGGYIFWNSPFLFCSPFIILVFGSPQSL